ncbi:MAG: Cysteine desulfurase [Lentisphaerae bacterium ADurb.BinA184]|nr:MAG: Cysteine desulfurase [Lentisphaerae bacterium ADurb.BinA184]
MIYLDHNATTPVAPEVVEAMAACLRDCPGNPSSVHRAGQEAARRLDRSREAVAALIGAAPDEIVFTSGATEADNQAVLGLGVSHDGRASHIVASAIEHQAVLAPARVAESAGTRLDLIGVDALGRVNPADVAAEAGSGTALISLMLANSETGVLQPVREIADFAKSRAIPMHTDAAQAVGKIAVDVRELGVDLLSMSAHKLRGPKGIGALYVRRDFPAPVWLHGGPQEGGRRGGTENLPGVVGFAKACELAAARLAEYIGRVGALRERLETGVRTRFPEAVVNGAGAARLPNTLSVSFPGIEGARLALSLDLAGIAVSTGSACCGKRPQASHVLLAMHHDYGVATCAVRFSLGWETTAAEIEATLAAVAATVPRLRTLNPEP